MTDSRNDARWHVVTTLKARWYDEEDGYDDERRAVIDNIVKHESAFVAPTQLRIGDGTASAFLDRVSSDEA